MTSDNTAESVKPLEDFGAQTLFDLVNKSFMYKRRFKVARVDQRFEKEPKMFWLSASYNTETEIFSVNDLLSYWLVYEVMEDK